MKTKHFNLCFKRSFPFRLQRYFSSGHIQMTQRVGDKPNLEMNFHKLLAGIPGGF